MKRVTALAVLALTAVMVVAGIASAKTYRKSLKPQPNREYAEIPNFKAKVQLKTGRRGFLKVTVTNMPEGKYYFDLRRAKSRRQPCSPDDTRVTGRGATRRIGKPRGNVAVKRNNRGSRTVRGRIRISRRQVYYVAIRKSKRARQTYMCNVVAGRVRR